VLDLEKGTATATPLAQEKLSFRDEFYSPTWSLDGQFLAYRAGPPNHVHEIRIVSVDSGATRVVHPDLSFVNSFRWAPDGRSFIASAQKTLGQMNIYRIDAISGNAAQIFDRQDKRPIRTGQWGFDRRGIFYVKGRGIVYRDLETGREREIFALDSGENNFRYEVSPDSRYLALVGREKATDTVTLRLITVDGGTSQDLCRLKTSVGTLVWTPDGRFVLFTQRANDKEGSLWYVSSSGGEPRQVELSGIESKSIANLAVHPDGKRIAFTLVGTHKSEVWALENFLPPLADAKPVAGADASSARSK
jgi:Tol biopolymer transport system component